MIQNDASLHESVVEYCNRVNSRLVVINSMQHDEIKTGSILEYI